MQFESVYFQQVTRIVKNLTYFFTFFLLFLYFVLNKIIIFASTNLKLRNYENVNFKHQSLISLVAS